MFASYRAKARAPRTALLQPVLALFLAALLGACSSSKQPAGPQVFAWLQPEPPPPAPIDPMDVEIEDDGLPAQTPPSPAFAKCRMIRLRLGVQTTVAVLPVLLTWKQCVRTPRTIAGSR